MNANVFIDHEPEARSLWDEDFHDRITRERNERWAKEEARERGLRLATEAEVSELMQDMLDEGFEFDDEGRISAYPIDPWEDERLLDDEEEDERHD